MIITCEKCSTKFNLDESLLKKEGSKVRCSMCKHIFKTYPPPPPDEDILQLDNELVLEQTPASTPKVEEVDAVFLATPSETELPTLSSENIEIVEQVEQSADTDSG
ncbi:MAG: zinc-ribbon domain-containing protein, partial [Desulfamplus sp.]|nr:zinc-ribbon domain-containing protein [Desulfamplus sp.]